jgi:cyclophilin family peptidyl-prolyl cis-trans isomerase
VFGKVTQGMDVVKKIEAVPTGNAGMFQNVPVKEVVITKMEVIHAAAPAKTGDTKKK